MAAPGATEFEAFAVRPQMAHDDVPPEVGVVPGDVPPLDVRRSTPLFRRPLLIVAGVVPDVKAVGKLSRPDQTLFIVRCSPLGPFTVKLFWSESFLPPPVQMVPVAVQLLVFGRTTETPFGAVGSVSPLAKRQVRR